MDEELNPHALAEWGQEVGSLEKRNGVQPVDERMIVDYVQDHNLLPTYSAIPFAEWLNESWFEYSEPGNCTNRQVIEDALVDWCGGRTARKTAT